MIASYNKGIASFQTLTFNVRLSFTPQQEVRTCAVGTPNTHTYTHTHTHTYTHTLLPRSTDLSSLLHLSARGHTLGGHLLHTLFQPTSTTDTSTANFNKPTFITINLQYFHVKKEFISHQQLHTHCHCQTGNYPSTSHAHIHSHLHSVLRLSSASDSWPSNYFLTSTSGPVRPSTFYTTLVWDSLTLTISPTNTI